jgi:hypothetical protein
MSENAADPDLARLLRLGPCRAPERRKPIRSTVPSGASVLLSGAGWACCVHQIAYREAILFP